MGLARRESWQSARSNQATIFSPPLRPRQMHRCAPYPFTEVNKDQHLHLLTVVDFWQLAPSSVVNR